MSLPVPRIEDPWQQRKPVFIAFGIIGILLGILWIWGGIATGESHPAHILRVLHDGHSPVPPPAAPSTPAPEITFYGKLVDEAGAPIPSAEVRITLRDPWQTIDRTTSPDGTFSIQRQRAEKLQVEVSKPGYSNVPLPSEGGVTSTTDFDYTEDPSFLTRHATSATPFVLTLWQPPHLIGPPTSHRLGLSATLDPAGRPHIIKVRNPTGGTALNSIELQYRHTKSTGPRSASHPYGWNLIITVPGGTLIEKDPAQVKPEAPATGYLPRIEIDFPATPKSASWQSGIHRHYYIHFPDNTYGVLSLRLNSFTHVIYGSVIHNFTPGDRDLFHPAP